MNIDKLLSNTSTFLKENWAIIIGVGIVTILVKSVEMLLVEVAYKKILREIEGYRKLSSLMNPISKESLKEMVGSRRQILSWMLSRRYILAECFDRLKDEGVILWSGELKAYYIRR